MQPKKIALSLTLLVLASVACKTVTGLGNVPQNPLPSVLTVVPTALEALGTAAAEITPPALEATSTPESPAASSPSGTSTSGLGIALDNVKNVMQATQQFTFSDETVNGQQAVVARLSATAATAMPAGSSLSAAFIGDPADLGEIRISVPVSTDQGAIEASLGMVTVLFASILPTDVLFTFLPWLTDHYSKVPEGGSEEMTSGKFKFTLSRTQTEMLLDIVPAR